jgi:hypothetical protein
MRFTPSPFIFGSKYGYSDLVLDIVLNFILFSRTILSVSFGKDYPLISFFYYIYLALLILAYFINFCAKPYYNIKYSRLRSF